MNKKQLLQILISSGLVSKDFFKSVKVGKKRYGKDLKNWKKPKEERVAMAKKRSKK